MRLLIFVLGCLLSVTTLASDIQPLNVSGWSDLQSSYAGQRHAVIFWSLTCVPCRQELSALGKQKNRGKLPISLINTDAQSQGQQVKAFLKKRGLLVMDNWQFSVAIPARLRQTIDPDWYGALPRSYAIDAKGKRFTHSGKADIKQLAAWLTE